MNTAWIILYIYLYTNAVVKYNLNIYIYFNEEEEAHDGKSAQGPWKSRGSLALLTSSINFGFPRGTG